MINTYFDNSATTYPKPQGVLDSTYDFFTKYAGNPGRSGHKISLDTAEKVYQVRKKVGKYFNASANSVVFTSNCTTAINTALKGILKENDHILTSNYEHNSVYRPIFDMFTKNYIKYDIFNVHLCNDDMIVDNIKNKINYKTKVLIITMASNVTGKIMPIKMISKLCKERSIVLIVDASQAAGIIPIDVVDLGIDILCTSAHKSLFGAGVGVLINNNDIRISPLTQGGTGTNSLEFTMPRDLPESLEAGTLNVLGIITLEAGIDFINNLNRYNNYIFEHENNLCNRLLNHFKNNDKIMVYRYPMDKYTPIVSFNMNNIDCEMVGEHLSENGFCLRTGYMCAALIHTKLNTTNSGVIRFSPSIFNTVKEVDSLYKCLIELL